MRTILLLSALAIAGCGSSPPQMATKTTLDRDPAKPIATVKGSVPGTTLGLISLRRSGPKVVTAKVRLFTEPDAKTFADKVDLSVATDVLDDAVAMRLIDEVNGREHFPLEDSGERCLCSSFTRLDPGQDVDLYAKFPAPPQGVTEVSLHVPNFPSFDNVRIAP